MVREPNRPPVQALRFFQLHIEIGEKDYFQPKTFCINAFFDERSLLTANKKREEGFKPFHSVYEPWCGPNLLPVHALRPSNTAFFLNILFLILGTIKMKMKKRYCHNYGPVELEKCGAILYGNRWQTELAKNLGLTDSRMIRYWLSRERNVPVYVWKNIVELVKEKQKQLGILLEDFE